MANDYSLDRIDRKILRHLQDEARLTNQALASRIALSPSACLARVRRLEALGIIQGYHARLDPFCVDVGLVLFVEITLEGRAPDEQARFEGVLSATPEIVEASHVSGRIDYLLKIVVRNMQHWTELREALVGGDYGVGSVTTHVLMDKPKVFKGYPVAERHADR
ncbi:AsnC family transcriptional regulator [Sphingopyxis bauzanensis]|uniref:AsnC family transcriptional regulator n=1 Tax=Sphingopyxis bauzanensis TaxID=651663 RepID=A0A246JW65_9SPHN|nr:Lrp/AsnC family transcriptional regulator [Sphingopyxis bauzanensis]OWQ97321.1 AsnC family transcriptional regulator [Sphingopyxis bauzanensis]GGJ49265.1 AsnC family transcriptional regulator [Sphingopyxis bauzanensis]